MNTKQENEINNYKNNINVFINSLKINNCEK